MLRDIIGAFQGGYEPDETAHAAVAIILRENQGSVEALLVKRAIREGDPWSGHMAFPGGRRSHRDRSIRETVKRETIEETAIDLNECTPVGVMEPITSTVSPELRVLPLIYVCRETPGITLNEELEASYWFPLEEMRNSKGTSHIHDSEFPAYLIEDKVIWGLTYRMLEKFYQTLDDTCQTISSRL